MNLTRKNYLTRREKIVDFVIGFGAWFGLNMFLLGLGAGLLAALAQITPAVYYSEAYTNFISLLGIMGICIPLLINIGLLIYLGLTRYWIALGALTAFAATLFSVLCLGTVLITYLSSADIRWN